MNYEMDNSVMAKLAKEVRSILPLPRSVLDIEQETHFERGNISDVSRAEAGDLRSEIERPSSDRAQSMRATSVNRVSWKETMRGCRRNRGRIRSGGLIRPRS